MRGLILGAIAALASAVVATNAAETPLGELRWTKRIVLVFAPPDDPLLMEQIAAFAQVPPTQWRNRDVVILHVPPEDESRTLFGTTPRRYSAKELRSAYGVDEGSAFTTMLLGKDGGVKWRELRPATAAEILALIDSMPMRARETGRNRAGG